MIPTSFEAEASRVEIALGSAVKTASSDQIDRERFTESLVNQEIQNRQIDGTKLPVFDSSPDIRTGVCGRIASKPIGFGYPKMLMKYPIRTATSTGAKPMKTKLKEGKENFVDRFFLWVNAFFK